MHLFSTNVLASHSISVSVLNYLLCSSLLLVVLLFSDHCMSRNRKSIWGRGVFGEFLARARARETGYLGNELFFST